jgi:hypothetical protein
MAIYYDKSVVERLLILFERCSFHFYTATFVDDAFLAVIRAKFPELDRWKVEKPLLYFRMLLNWELGKRVFSGKETNVVVPLP